MWSSQQKQKNYEQINKYSIVVQLDECFNTVLKNIPPVLMWLKMHTT